MTDETAAPKGSDAYEWRTYTGVRGTHLQTTNRKQQVMLREGSRFGLRPASRGDKLRLITEELGPTIVFTVAQADADKLSKKSRPVRGRKPAGKAPAQSPIPHPAKVKAETQSAATARAAERTRATLVEAFAGLDAKASRAYLTWLVDNGERPSLKTVAAWKRSARR